MNNRTLTIALLSLVLWAFSLERSAAQQAIEDYSPRPFAQAPHVKDPPVIDGDLSDPAYARAQPLLGFNSRFLRLPVSQQTEVRLVWTDQGLYSAVSCSEDDMDEVVSIATEHDGNIFGDNSIALTLTPTEDLSSFFQFGTNTLGILYDEQSGNTAWDGKWTVAVRQQTDGWTAESFVPWSTLGRCPKQGECWGIGVARVEGPYAEYSDWAVVNGDYGQRDRHGQIVFTDRTDLPYLVIHSPERLVSGYNRVSGEIVRPASAEAVYTVQFQRWEQQPGRSPLEMDLAKQSVSGATSSFIFETTVEHPGTNLLTFTLLSGSKLLYRTTLGYHVKPVQGERFALESKQPTYTWEEEARFYLSVDPSENLTDLEIVTRVYDKTGRVMQVDRTPISGPHHVVRIPIRDLPDATYRADIAIMRAEKTVTSWSVMFTRKSSVPPPLRVSARLDGTILVGDQPFFPLGMFQVPDIAELAKAGFNLVIDRSIPDFSREQEMLRYLDRCQELGLRAILFAEPYLLPEMDREGLREAVCRVKDHPALLGYLLLNQPSQSGIEPGYLDTARAIIRDVDRFHPVFVREETPIMFPGYAGTCDVFMASSNPVPFSPLDLVGDVLDRAWQSVRGRRSVLACLQAFGPPQAARHPTMKQSRVMAWMALIHNAKGLSWWSCQETKRCGHWDDFEQLVKDLKPILPFLLHGEIGPLQVSESSPGVHLRTWTSDGKVLVLAANAQAGFGRIALRGMWDQADNLLDGKPSIEPPHEGHPARILLKPFDVAALVLPLGQP